MSFPPDSDTVPAISVASQSLRDISQLRQATFEEMLPGGSTPVVDAVQDGLTVLLLKTQKRPRDQKVVCDTGELANKRGSAKWVVLNVGGQRFIPNYQALSRVQMYEFPGILTRIALRIGQHWHPGLTFALQHLKKSNGLALALTRT